MPRTRECSRRLGYLDVVAEDEDDEVVPVELEFTYENATDQITFVLPMFYPEDNTPVYITIVFSRNE